MAALHPVETALRQASKAGHNSSQPGSGGKDCAGHYDTRKVKLAKITKQAEVRLVKYLSCWWEFDISASIKLGDSNISCHK